jgi:hypothetical protein
VLFYLVNATSVRLFSAAKLLPDQYDEVRAPDPNPAPYNGGWPLAS